MQSVVILELSTYAWYGREVLQVSPSPPQRLFLQSPCLFTFPYMSCLVQLFCLLCWFLIHSSKKTFSFNTKHGWLKVNKHELIYNMEHPFKGARMWHPDVKLGCLVLQLWFQAFIQSVLFTPTAGSHHARCWPDHQKQSGVQCGVHSDTWTGGQGAGIAPQTDLKSPSKRPPTVCFCLLRPVILKQRSGDQLRVCAFFQAVHEKVSNEFIWIILILFIYLFYFLKKDFIIQRFLFQTTCIMVILCWDGAKIFNASFLCCIKCLQGTFIRGGPL